MSQRWQEQRSLRLPESRPPRSPRSRRQRQSHRFRRSSKSRRSRRQRQSQRSRRSSKSRRSLLGIRTRQCRQRRRRHFHRVRRLGFRRYPARHRQRWPDLPCPPERLRRCSAELPTRYPRRQARQPLRQGPTHRHYKRRAGTRGLRQRCRRIEASWVTGGESGVYRVSSFEQGNRLTPASSIGRELAPV